MGLCGDCCRSVNNVHVHPHFDEDSLKNRFLIKRRSFMCYTIVILLAKSIQAIPDLYNVSKTYKNADDQLRDIYGFLLLLATGNFLLEATQWGLVAYALIKWRHYQTSAKCAIVALLLSLIYPLFFLFIPVTSIDNGNHALVLVIFELLIPLLMPNVMALYTICLGIFRTRKLFDSDSEPLHLLQLVLTFLIISVLSLPAFVVYQSIAIYSDQADTRHLEYIFLGAYFSLSGALTVKCLDVRSTLGNYLNTLMSAAVVALSLTLFLMLGLEDLLGSLLGSAIATYTFNRLAYQDLIIFLSRGMAPTKQIWEQSEPMSGHMELPSYEEGPFSNKVTHGS